MDKKVVVVINLEFNDGWIPYNGITHISLAMGQRLTADWFGEHPLETKDEKAFSGILKYPVIVKEANLAVLRKIVKRAFYDATIRLVCFTTEMIETGPDADLVNAMGNRFADDLIFTAVAIAGEKKRVDEITIGSKLFKLAT